MLSCEAPSSHFPQDAFQRVVRSQRSPVLARKRVVIQRLFDPGTHQLRGIRQLHLFQLYRNLLGLLSRRHAIFLRMDGLEVESPGEFYPEAQWQRCAVHFYRNVWTAVPTGRVKEVRRRASRLARSRPAAAPSGALHGQRRS